MRIAERRRIRRGLGLGATVVALAAVSMACVTPPPPTGGIPPQPNQTTGYVAEYNSFRATSTDPTKRPWFCHALGSGAHTHAAGNDVEQGPEIPVPAYDGLVRGALSWEDCLTNAQSYDAALAYAQRFPTVAAAERAGFVRTVQYEAGMGTHHQLMSSGYTFNPRQPNTLQYSGNSPDSVLIGMSWLVRNGVPLGQPPAGFAGANDVWHPHRDLCYQGRDVIANNVGSTRCRQLGGTLAPINLWMAHAWIVPNMQFQTDVNAGVHPCLLASGLAAAGDQCWSHAQHDHSLEPDDHGDHDDH
jgi:hypothetical protein